MIGQRKKNGLKLYFYFKYTYFIIHNQQSLEIFFRFYKNDREINFENMQRLNW